MMAVEILQRYSATERAGLLASIALAKNNPVSSTLNEEQKAISKAVYDFVNGAKRFSPEIADARVNQAISQIISESLLSEERKNEVLARAGEAGTLPSSMYEVEIPRSFSITFHPFHVRDADVLSNVELADDVQHLECGSDLCVSLFARLIENKSGRDPYWTVAQFHRSGAHLVAHDFWRIYPSEIDIRQAQEPVDLIKALVSRVGGDVTVNGMRGQYFRNVRLPLETKDFKLEVSINPIILGTMSTVGTALSSAPEIVLAYGINAEKYRDYLIRHKVPVSAIPIRYANVERRALSA